MALLEKEHQLKSRSVDTIKIAIRRIEEWDDLAIIEEGDNVFTPMPPFTFEGLDASQTLTKLTYSFQNFSATH